jgi:hypothetical protein
LDSRRNRIQGVLLWDGSAFKRAPGTLLEAYLLQPGALRLFRKEPPRGSISRRERLSADTRQGWTLHLAHTRGSALAVLREKAHSGRHCWNGLCRAGDWKDLFAALELLPHNPLLLVPSRLADEHLWVEVLNLSGHDIVPCSRLTRSSTSRTGLPVE